MTSPTHEQTLFTSSSPLSLLSLGVDGEVSKLLQQAKRVTSLSPSHEAIVSSNPGALLTWLDRHLNLIKSRSQDLRDCQLTIYDKVLLELTEHGVKVDDPPSISFFCHEFLGIPSYAPEDEEPVLLPCADELDMPITQARTPPATQFGSTASAGDEALSSGTELVIAQTLPQKQNTDLASLAQQIDAPTGRLWGVYEVAKSDFFTITDPNAPEKLSAARYLRDTAENALDHLRQKEVDNRLIHELQSVFGIAKETATTLHGGKKRKFDHPGPYTSDQRPLSKHKSHKEHFRSNTVREPHQSYGYAGHAIRMPRHDPGPFENVRYPRKNWFGGSSRNQVLTGRRRQQPGKGHSGIPYGYSQDRSVDSYTPGRS